MFFAQLNKKLKTSNNPNHPSNSEKSRVKVTTARAPDSPGRVEKKSTLQTKRLQKKATPVYSSPPVVDSRDVTATPEPVVDTSRVLFRRSEEQPGKPLQSGQQAAKNGQYTNLFDEATEFDLELPFGTEHYEAVEPTKDDLNLLDEMDTTMEIVAKLTAEPEKIKDPDMRDCILRRVRKSRRAKDRAGFLAAVDEYNQLVRSKRADGEFERVINQTNRPEFGLVQNLLNMVYARVVSPQAHELRNYRAFSNNVYGELLPKFASKIFTETGLTSSSVFVDLGSGVGNCVLQASLEIGCESIGCEVMQAASDMARRQQLEFEPRVAMYGLHHGPILLKSADFTQDQDIIKGMQRASVVLVNNYAFDDELNNALVNMFLDLEEGCKIVSLKSFVPQDHAITAHNIHSPLNILSVKKHHFGSNCVSWTNAGGVYYVSTIDRSRIAKFQ